MMEEEPGLYYVEETNPLLTHSSINQDVSLGLSVALKPRDHAYMSKKRIIRNLIVLGMSCFIFFFGFQSLSNLQSTMNSAKGLGMDSQAVIYACSMASALLLPDFLIKNFGCKRIIIVMLLGSLPYIASNFSPRWDTIIPASVLMGFAIGPLNSASAMYVNEMALRYNKLTCSESLETTIAKFFGIFSFFLENTQIWGNLVSYYILRPGIAPIHHNNTNLTCGIDFDRTLNNTNPNLQPPSQDKRILLVSMYVLSNVVAVFLMGLFTDKLENDIEPSKGKGCSSILERLFSAAKQLTTPNQILLIPITTFVGLELAFYTGEFTQAYIACSWGVHHVGFVTICFGVCGALMSILVGPLVKCISQMAVLMLAACANISMCVLLFLWHPTPEQSSIYFIIAGIWGMGDAIWWSQITALYGLMFPNDREAAFSNLYFWSFLGFFLSYSYANYLTVPVKINILLAFLITGMLGYLIGQLKIKCTARKEYVSIEDDH